ncbi:uncharacterized protein FOBCDRAFT_321496 [Fusarium oxysporum Fo47]|uniref:Uncharacterized protein n=1 Tax=Fusarium oxysporum Fo47 TaxID=660027 RepID=W9JI49_FUSOX|nr:uncharacterized protein FOBCDRAFT_321496 [Fusarium oxysporum Fo47]EWZ29118.1 hypothetical protein FOZG_17217 [Fusarium oxysporum Fo47]QKD57619.1 hypothetical protein FOBCDRAFT_321496 [Fusarium oxysporum Fo47]
MFAKDPEAASRRHYQIHNTIKRWKTCDARVDLSPPPEFTDLQTTFQNILFERKVKPLDIPGYVKMLQNAEERRAATACADIFEKMDKELFFGLCQDLGPRLCQKWFNELQVINQLPEDTTPSNNDTQLSSEQTADGLHCIRESPAPQYGEKEPWKTFTHTFVCNPSTAEDESSQVAQLISSQPDEIEYTDELDCEPRTSRVHPHTKGQEDGTQRSNKRRCMRKPRDTQVEPDDQYSSDQSNDTAPFTDDDSEACTEFCGDKNIENDFHGVSKDQVHQST